METTEAEGGVKGKSPKARELAVMGAAVAVTIGLAMWQADGLLDGAHRERECKVSSISGYESFAKETGNVDPALLAARMEICEGKGGGSGSTRATGE